MLLDKLNIQKERQKATIESKLKLLKVIEMSIKKVKLERTRNSKKALKGDKLAQRNEFKLMGKYEALEDLVTELVSKGLI